MLVKFVPDIVTVAPTAPLSGLKPVMVGLGNTVKFDALVMVTPLDPTEIGPFTAPAGTVVVMLVVFEEVTLVTPPLNETVGVPLKFVPEIITVAPIAPLIGLKPVIVGVSRTVKLEEVEIVTPLTVTNIFPDVAPTGTVVVMLVAVEEETVATVPLKVTTFSPGVVLKLVPVMVTVVPSAPLSGVKLEMVGDATTTKLVALVRVTPLVVTVIGPDAAPEGTEVVILVAFEDATVALIPLNDTVGEALKFVPVIMTTAPGAPLKGLNSVRVGVSRTVKFDGLETVTPFKVNVTGPVVAPAGTVVVNICPLGFELVTTASIPLNFNTFCEAVVLKLFPLIVIVAPIAALFGRTLVI